jgi:serine phosphatase RsbU (regulator of sigma subunit)
MSAAMFDTVCLFGVNNHVNFSIPVIFKSVSINIFLIGTMLFFKLEIGSVQNLNFREMLWKTFLTAAASILVISIIKLFAGLMEDTVMEHNTLITNLFYNINAAFITIFLANSFYVFKRLVLYQKTKIIQQFWNIFEISIYIVTVFNFFDVEQISQKYIIMLVPLSVAALVLSFNVRWVPYLNFNHKWQCILLLVLILAISAIFVDFYLDFNHAYFSDIDISRNIFSFTLFIFVILYCLISLLVLLFNLPTSSVFEQKFEEVLGFQKLSQTVHIENDEHKIYNVLFESCYNTVLGDGGWLEIVDERGNVTTMVLEQFTREQVYKMKTLLRKSGIKISSDAFLAKDLKKIHFKESIADINFSSMLILPLYSNGNRIGTLGLMRKVKDGFDKEIIDIVKTYISQASISIQNARLINEAIDNERYKAQLNVARKVQQSLLPSNIDSEVMDMAVYYESAEDVGGDYYDIFRVAEHNFSVVIGDVSGKSTSAAFNMAQMKGIFNSLIHFEMLPHEFMIHANRALSTCLEKSSFVTLSMFNIDLQNHTIDMARAGHCPTLFYSAKNNQSEFLHSEGLGLGILRNNSYAQFIETKSITFDKDDILLLYTDGITEAKNDQGDEFGYDALLSIVTQYSHLSSKELTKMVMDEVMSFTKGSKPEDDYTLLAIKFI